MADICRMDEAQFRKAKKLIRGLCCNYDGGNCLLLDDGEPCVCVQSISYSLLCRWFQAAVLPVDGALYAEITEGKGGLKRCAACGAYFLPTGSRSLYCPSCAAQRTRRRKAAWARKTRAGA